MITGYIIPRRITVEDTLPNGVSRMVSNEVFVIASGLDLADVMCVFDSQKAAETFAEYAGIEILSDKQECFQVDAFDSFNQMYFK